MVRINIYVPCVDDTFNFSLEEKEKISSLISGVSRLIENRRDEAGMGEGDQVYLLLSRIHGCILNPDKTLAYYDIRTGDELVLI